MLGFPPKLNVADRGSEIKTTIMVSMPKQKVVKSPANNIEKIKQQLAELSGKAVI